jgi:hypothetical protein
MFPLMQRKARHERHFTTQFAGNPAEQRARRRRRGWLRLQLWRLRQRPPLLQPQSRLQEVGPSIPQCRWNWPRSNTRPFLSLVLSTTINGVACRGLIVPSLPYRRSW